MSHTTIMPGLPLDVPYWEIVQESSRVCLFDTSTEFYVVAALMLGGAGLYITLACHIIAALFSWAMRRLPRGKI